MTGIEPAPRPFSPCGRRDALAIVAPAVLPVSEDAILEWRLLVEDDAADFELALVSVVNPWR